jgi:glycerophosphoryl diester phosphodiesterase
MAQLLTVLPICKRPLAACVVLTCAFASSLAQADERQAFPFFEPIMPPRPVQVMVHRGTNGRAPENTAAGLETCIDDGFEWAEVDVRLSKDGKHLLFHDGQLNGKTSGAGPFADRTAAELLELDAGSWFARRFARTRLLTLEQALQLGKGRINFYLDCKRIDPALLVKEISATGMERQVVVYDQPAVITRVRELSQGKIATMTKWRPRFGPVAGWVAELRPAAVEIDADDVTPEVCREFHKLGVKVQAKTLGEKWDRPAVWEPVIAAGVDWVQTDLPLEVLTHSLRRRLPVWPVRVSFHRGANRYAPENTLPALERAARLGADYIEIDIRTSKDGHCFLLHDARLDRTTDVRGPLGQLTAAELVKLDAGAWFGKPFIGTELPAFEDGLTAMGERAHAYLDAKDISPEKLGEVLQRRKLLERSVVYQRVEYLRKLKELQPGARALPPLSHIRQLEAVAELKPYGVDASWQVLSKELIDRCHAKGIQVFSDALGSHEMIKDYQQAIAWGIDVIQTDHPARVLRAIELLEEQKMPRSGDRINQLR